MTKEEYEELVDKKIGGIYIAESEDKECKK